MKNTLLKIVLISSAFFSASVHGMSCTINSINSNVNTILQIVSNFSETGIDVQVSGIDQLIADISLVGDVLSSKLSGIESQLDELLGASAAETLCMLISMPTTISMPGTYCLSQDIAGTITINSSNVTLDLNGHQVTMGITITAGHDTVSITNGTVLGGSPGIFVQAGCTNISITSVLVKNGTSGILFEQVNGALVEHCTLTNNMTGIMLVNSNRINVLDTVATANTYAGFDLVSSCTNSFIECKALSTGQNNTNIFNNEVVGFISNNGYGNIFERCIANGTQALSTTDSNSLVAGFALFGSESCSKIIGCESANANASGNGVTVPYGILLQGTIDLSVVLAPNTGNLFNSIDWSPDGQYVAVGIEIGGVEYGFLIYSFDRVNNTLTAISGALNTNTDSIYSVNWSPDGRHLAVAGNLVSVGYGLQIYTFDPINNSLTAGPGVLAPDFSQSASVDWSPNGQYVAVCGLGLSSGHGLQIYSFDPIANTLIVGPGALSSGDYPTSVNWSPDGQYVAVCGNLASTNNGLQIYSFDQSTNTLTPGPGALSMSQYNSSVAWSPDGQYVAVGARSIGAYGFQVFGFIRPGTLIPGPGEIDYGFSPNPATFVASIDWSPDGQYIIVLGNLVYSGYGLQIYYFDQSSNVLILGPGALNPIGSSFSSVSWSPDGHYVASCDQSGDFDIVQALQFPSQNVITDNTVYCNGHDVSNPFTGAVGVGISGSSIGNMIIGNTAYNNPPISSNFFVPSNYYFVTNVFNPLYGQAPTALQNISLNACDPIVMPIDVGLLAQQILYKASVSIPSQLDAAESAIIAALNSNGPCASTPITIGTTITAAGNYCVANSLPSNSNIVINASDVNLDLSNRTITGTITINANMSGVSISNGTINANGAASGILVNSGASNVSISNVTVKNATTGIDFMSVYDAAIQGCTLTQNITGLQLNSSYNVQVSDTVASSNVNAGFDLVSSFTNSFINCKALSTGQNNAVIYNNEVIGFSSENGYGNIFERCIANGTQALSTTDSNSLVAGFVLRGSEACSKIIECESANANASGNGVTVPYGILLQGTLDGLLGVTGALDPNYPSNNDVVELLNWSPDGQYLAVGGQFFSANDGAGYALQIYSFNRVTNALIAGPGALDPYKNDSVYSVNWSPDGQYVAVGGSFPSVGYNLQIYSFDRLNNTLVVGPEILGSNDSVGSVNWSPDGQYLAVCGYLYSVDYGLQIYSFNRLSNTLVAGPGALSSNDYCESVNWSPDGQYLAVGGQFYSTGYSLQIYSFSSNTLLAGPGALNSHYVDPDIVFLLNWSPDGQYLAVGGGLYTSNAGAGYSLQIYSFDRSSNTLLPGPGALNPNYLPNNDFVFAVNWSPDGQYIAIGGGLHSANAGAGYAFQIYSFNRSSNTLMAGPGLFDPYSPNNDVVFAVNWTPDGQYIAAGAQLYSVNKPFGFGFEIITALQFPFQNVITDNTVYCNGHDVSATFTGATGVGISGTLICNMITRNTAYNNPPISSNFFVPSNYTFVTNVFNPLFGQAPTALQNISLNACDPIVAPVDVGLLAQQILYDVGITIPSQINALEAVILSAIDNIQTPCAPTAITMGTTITAAGNYCLAQNIMDSIVINASDVYLDLNNHKVTGTINVLPSQNQVTIKNGVVDANGGENGIWVEGNNADIIIANVTIKNANSDMNSTGIVFYSTQDATIENCTLTQNSIGLQLNNSYNVQVSDTVASSNVNVGFDLISSFTNSFINCKALSTGQNNAVIYNTEVVGFSSENGYGNIFERCIANGTQALSTTDSSSLVAGFALLGSESCSKIIGCESANANASGMGVTVPYGILLQGTLDGTFNVTGALLNNSEDTEIGLVDWSPDGQYVAIVGGGIINEGDLFQIFQFNRVTNTLVAVAGALSNVNDGINAVDWSPDGQYVAIVGITIIDGYPGEYQFQIFAFDRISNALTAVAGAITSGNIFSVNWSPDGQYVAIGGIGIIDGYPGNNQFQIFAFDRVTNALMPVAGALLANFDNEIVYSVNWSPDGQYVAIGGNAISDGYGPGDQFQIFEFDRSTNNLMPVAGALSVNYPNNIVYSVNWSPDGQYVAIGGNAISDGYGPGDQFQIFEFDRSTNNLMPVAGALLFPDAVNSVNWSPDGQYLAVGGHNISDNSGNQFQIFAFDRSNNNLASVAGSLSDSADDGVKSVNWSPDGQYVALSGAVTENSGNQLQIFTGIQFPSQNVITDNTVYCNGHDVSATFTGATGVGISGTSICNMITRNTAYNNPPTTSNFFVPSNYYFVTNVFNPLYGQAPTALQNISLNACDPIVAPVDVGLLAQQILYNVAVSIPLQLDVILAAVESGAPCIPTAITMGTTITAAGNYCLSASITGSIAITASDVYLNLNNRTVTGTITINATMSGVNISNGTINANGGASGILVNPGASNITISNVTVKNATTGIDFMSAYDAAIQGCTLTQNITGLQLNSSYNVNVSDTIASSNIHAGFDVIASSTNSFINCKALSTGKNNTNILNNEVVGFSSENGYGNIFERCIANGTQALSTTDSSSFIAGFVLRGSESCSKIISCESANATASGIGVTVPYGILLQGSLDGTFNVTGAIGASSGLTVVSALNWSPDGQYVAIGGVAITDGYGNNGQFQIFEFDRVTNTLVFVAGALSMGSPNIASVNWSPDGQYLAIGGAAITDGYGTNNKFQIFQFDRVTNTLTPVAGTLSGGSDDVTSVNWSPDGQYLAVGGALVSVGYGLQIYSFNRLSNTLVLAGTGVLRSNDDVSSVDWSPDGQYVAIGGFGITDGYPGNNNFQIFEFDRSSNNLTAVAGALSGSSFVISVNWSPDGQYVAIGGFGITGGFMNGTYQFQIFEFNRSNNNLIAVAGVLSTGPHIISVNWSPDGQYVTIGGHLITGGYGTNNQFQIFAFDRSNNDLTPEAGALSSISEFVYSVNWSPDGQYVAIGGSIISQNSGNQFQIFTALQFPSQNVITDNTVYCNGHDVSATFTGAVGVGISGTSICNMIIGNTVYNNPPTTSNFFVPSDYQFVTNVFNQAFGQGPTALQNIALNACQPIVAPMDAGLLALENQYLLQSIIAILATKT